MPEGGPSPQAARWLPAIEPAPDRSKSSIDAVGRGLTSITVMLSPASTTRSTPTRPTGWNRSARMLPNRSSDAIKGSVSVRPPAACRATAPHQANIPAWHHGSPINCRLTPSSRAEPCLKQYDADRGVPIMNRCQIRVGRGVMACLVVCSAATSGVHRRMPRPPAPASGLTRNVPSSGTPSGEESVSGNDRPAAWATAASCTGSRSRRTTSLGLPASGRTRAMASIRSGWFSIAPV